MESEHNFELGTEFESVLVEFLKRVLPSRFGVCRGYVVTRDGAKAGDDIIVYDQARFPTLRVLQKDSGRKEYVPAEAVIAYIEAKHTLQVQGTDGQALAKGCAQVRAVKNLPREARPLSEVVPFVDLEDALEFDTPAGFPRIRNPWYGAIIARRFNPSDTTPMGLLKVVRDLPLPLPDLIVAGDVVIVPARVVKAARASVGLRPIFDPAHNTLIAARARNSFGFGIAHLLWAAEMIELGGVPWTEILGEAIREGDDSFVC
ncbi:MAG TPA: DUF6602 domain-containing protein [Polyangiaceae bacterium]|nr:DUF6602 domain-containing protein [Polyangiaceae bacterium]